MDFRSEAMPDHLGPKGFTVEKQNERVKKGLLPQTWEDAEGKVCRPGGATRYTPRAETFT